MSNSVGSIGIRPEISTGNLNKSNSKSGGAEFKQALDNASLDSKPKEAAAVKTRKLEFSNHAVDRMRSRGIHFTPDQLDKIEAAAVKAKAKGAKETLMVTDNSALIVSIKDDKIVTVMDKAMLKDNVFTKIDSTVII